MRTWQASGALVAKGSLGPRCSKITVHTESNEREVKHDLVQGFGSGIRNRCGESVGENGAIEGIEQRDGGNCALPYDPTRLFARMVYYRHDLVSKRESRDYNSSYLWLTSSLFVIVCLSGARWKYCHCRAVLSDEADYLEIRTVPLNGWISTASLSLITFGIGSLALYVDFGEYWNFAVMAWVVAGLFASKIRSERYIFDRAQGTLRVKTVALPKPSSASYWLDEIKSIKLERTVDVQGGEDAQIYVRMDDGRMITILAGHFCGRTLKLKEELLKRIQEFMRGFHELHMKEQFKSPLEPLSIQEHRDNGKLDRNPSPPHGSENIDRKGFELDLSNSEESV